MRYLGRSEYETETYRDWEEYFPVFLHKNWFTKIYYTSLYVIANIEYTCRKILTKAHFWGFLGGLTACWLDILLWIINLCIRAVFVSIRIAKSHRCESCFCLFGSKSISRILSCIFNYFPLYLHWFCWTGKQSELIGCCISHIKYSRAFTCPCIFIRTLVHYGIKEATSWTGDFHSHFSDIYIGAKYFCEHLLGYSNSSYHLVSCRGISTISCDQSWCISDATVPADISIIRRS